MNLENKKIGFCFTGSFCTFSKTIEELEKISKINGIEIYPIMSNNAYNLDTKFGLAKEFREKIEKITGHKIINSIQDAEPIGPSHMFDILVVCPASGNTIAKLSNDIIDNPVCMAVKSHLRNEKPVVLGISSNNGLSGAAENIGRLLNRKYYYFIPFRQDNPITKPNSLVFDITYLSKTIEYALEYKQIQPILL